MVIRSISQTTKGKVVFLNFWATWCKPCIAEMPSIERVMAKMEGQDVVFFAASDEKVEKIRKFMGKYDFSFQFIRILEDFNNMEVYSLPTTFIYGRDGNVFLNEAGAQ